MPTVQKRRTFIKHLSLGSGAICLSPLLSQCGESGESELFKNFAHPKLEARPFFRWWWNGNRLSKTEIVRELALMKAAGIGGIEINPIEMPEAAEHVGDDEVTWLSDEWIDYLEFTIKKAKDLGMITDLIVGTGWPFGGEFLKPEETIQGLRVETIELSGPGQKEIPLPAFSDEYHSVIKKITLFPDEIENMTQGREVIFDQRQSTITVEVPEGDYKLYILTWQNNFRSVMHGAPGGAGPVLDHFNKNAVEKYLHHMSDTIKKKTGKKKLEGIRAMFCDSIELNGANWTQGFEEIFRARRGYEIMPYLPLLLAKDIRIAPEMQDEIKRAKFDYSQTLSEIFTENFIIPFHNWCHENGTLSRYQAYGHPWLYTDLLDGYMIPDIPEGDQWLFNGGWQPHADVDQIRYAIWNKYASSAANLAGRKIASSEAMTNTSGVFKASLKYIKQATDLNFAAGINHLVLHGFNYSPPEAGFPGWVRYGCYFSEQNPWWPYMPQWSAYCARISQLLQDSAALSQVAILGPTLDIWSSYGLDRNPFNLEPWYLHALWQALNHIGYCSDYINENLLKNARLENGKIVIGAMTYDILMLCDVETVTADVAKKIEELTTLGAKIIQIGKKPSRLPAMIGGLMQDGIVAKAMDNARFAGVLMAPAPDLTLLDSQCKLMSWVSELMNNCGIIPNIYISNPQPQLFQTHRKNAHRDILFMANVDKNQSYSTMVSLDKKSNYASLWNPFTGKKSKLNTFKNNLLRIELQPLESVVIVFDNEDKTESIVPEEVEPVKEAFEINGDWEVTLKTPDQSLKTLTLNELIPIEEMEEMGHFGGEIMYKIQFNVISNVYSTLVIGEVHETAEIFLNGNNIGVSWWGNNHFDLNKKLRKGRNTLEIKVTTLLANYCASLKDNGTAQYWTSLYKDKTPVRCGLAGKVWLQ